MVVNNEDQWYTPQAFVLVQSLLFNAHRLDEESQVAGHPDNYIFYTTLLLKAKWSSMYLLLQDLFCICITLLRNIETGRTVSLGAVWLIWLPGSSVSVQDGFYSQQNRCFFNTPAKKGLVECVNANFLLDFFICTLARCAQADVTGHTLNQLAFLSRAKQIHSVDATDIFACVDLE